MVGMIPSGLAEAGGFLPAQAPPPGFEAGAAAEGGARDAFDRCRGECLGFVELAIARIARGEAVEAALRELEAFLIEILALVERDPGLALASEDLHRAAAMIVGDRRAGLARIDPRRWRLLMDAARRFRARLEAAAPSRARGQAPLALMAAGCGARR